MELRCSRMDLALFNGVWADWEVKGRKVSTMFTPAGQNH